MKFISALYRSTILRFSLALVFANIATVQLNLAYAQSAQPTPFSSAARYDNYGRVVGTIAPDPDGAGEIGFAATRTSYDAQGLVTKIETGELAAWQPSDIAPMNWPNFTILSTETRTYDTMNQLVKKTVAGGDAVAVSVTQMNYDRIGRPACTATRMNSAEFNTLEVNACILDTAGTLGSDRITRNRYDAAGQVLRVQKAVGTSIEQDYVTYTYTNNGKQSSVKDANGNLASLTYDGHDRQVRWTFPSKTSVGSVDATDYEEYGYDANGNRTSLRKRDGSTLTYTYDALNRNTVKVVPERAGLPATHSRDIYYGYDLRGLQTYARFDSASGEGITTAYDGFGRMQSSTINMDGVTRPLSYQFDKNSNRTRVTHGDGVYFQMDYDGLNRFSALKENGAAVLLSHAYNARGQVGNGARLSGGSSTAYDYDPVGRTTSISHDLAATAQDISYGLSYNPASQIITRTVSNDAYMYAGNVNVDRNYGINGLNQYTSAGPASFSYDANGNLTSDGSSTYVYDVENRLVSASGGTSATLRYDPLGRLYETGGGSVGITRFQYDGDELIAEYSSAGAMLRRYVHGASVDDPVVWYEAGAPSPTGLRQLFTNHQGSVVAVTDGNSNILSINSYDEWGVPSGMVPGTVPNTGRFQYTGQAWIPELKMYHYKARIYSPTLGRFMQTDPIGYEDQINLYAYVGNDPVNMLDADGTNGIPIYGLPQRPNGPNGASHASQSEELARRMAKVPGVKSIHLNQQLRTITNGKVNSSIQPDVSMVMESGKVHPFEIPSGRQGHAYFQKKYGSLSAADRKTVGNYRMVGGTGDAAMKALSEPVRGGGRAAAGARVPGGSARIMGSLGIFGVFSDILGIMSGRITIPTHEDVFAPPCASWRDPCST